MVPTRDRLRFLRDRKGMLQSEVAQQLNMPVATYSSYENGSNPKPEVLIQLAKYHDTTTDYLLGMSDEMFPVKDKISTSLAKLSRQGTNTLSSNDIIEFAEAAIRYCRAGKPCGNIPLNACQEFLVNLTAALNDASKEEVINMVDNINAATVAALKITKMPALYYAKHKGNEDA